MRKGVSTLVYIMAFADYYVKIWDEIVKDIQPDLTLSTTEKKDIISKKLEDLDNLEITIKEEGFNKAFREHTGFRQYVEKSIEHETAFKFLNF